MITILLVAIAFLLIDRTLSYALTNSILLFISYPIRRPFEIVAEKRAEKEKQKILKAVEKETGVLFDRVWYSHDFCQYRFVKKLADEQIMRVEYSIKQIEELKEKHKDEN